jgi:hypothetical protein
MAWGHYNIGIGFSLWLYAVWQVIATVIGVEEYTEIGNRMVREGIGRN